MRNVNASGIWRGGCSGITFEIPLVHHRRTQKQIIPPKKQENHREKERGGAHHFKRATVKCPHQGPGKLPGDKKPVVQGRWKTRRGGTGDGRNRRAGFG